MCRKEAELFKVLGVESRIRIIDLLKQRGSMYVNEIAQVLAITPSAVSQHLKILRHAGLVRNQRKGFWIPYEVDQAALAQCGEIISNVCRCGCEDSCRGAEPEEDEKINSEGEDLAYLKKLEKELEVELQRVRSRMEKVREET